MYYNTNSERGGKLSKYKESNKKQDQIILAFFKDNPNNCYPPYRVHELTKLKCPLSSIRRSLTDLTSNGLLEKTANKVMGLYDREVCTWKLKKLELF